jgi:hypothetical protein
MKLIRHIPGNSLLDHRKNDVSEELEVDPVKRN